MNDNTLSVYTRLKDCLSPETFTNLLTISDCVVRKKHPLSASSWHDAQNPEK